MDRTCGTQLHNFSDFTVRHEFPIRLPGCEDITDMVNVWPKEITNVMNEIIRYAEEQVNKGKFPDLAKEYSISNEDEWKQYSQEMTGLNCSHDCFFGKKRKEKSEQDLVTKRRKTSSDSLFVEEETETIIAVPV